MSANDDFGYICIATDFLKQAILQAFVDIENAYVVPKNERPFRLKKVEKGYAYFQLEDIFVFSGFYRR